MSDDDDEGLDWDEWMKLSDAQAEAIADRHMKEYLIWLNSLAPEHYYRYQRGSALRSLREARKFLSNKMMHRIDVIDDLQRERIRSVRLRLLKLRIFRSTGVYPGTA